MRKQRLLLNPPSEHIGPAAKHRWEDRSPEQKPDRYVEYEQASAAARELRLAHARDAAEAAEARWRIETLDVKIAALEAEQRRADAAARRRKEDCRAARRGAAPGRGEVEREGRRTAKLRSASSPGGVELYLAHLADIDPKWNVNDNHATTRGNVDAALERRRVRRAPSRAPARRADGRGRRRPLPSAARQGRRAGRYGGSRRSSRAGRSIPQKRVLRLRELFAAPGG